MNSRLRFQGVPMEGTDLKKRKDTPRTRVTTDVLKVRLPDYDPGHHCPRCSQPMNTSERRDGLCYRCKGDLSLESWERRDYQPDRYF